MTNSRRVLVHGNVNVNVVVVVNGRSTEDTVRLDDDRCRPPHDNDNDNDNDDDDNAATLSWIPPRSQRLSQRTSYATAWARRASAAG
jgi:hypothetical protein